MTPRVDGGLRSGRTVEASTRVRLGRSQLLVPRMGLGTGPIGDLQEPVADDEALAVIRRAFESGARYVDTAPGYGMGLAERRLSDVLPQLARDEYVLSTKVGRLIRRTTTGAKVAEVVRESLSNRDARRFVGATRRAARRLRAHGRLRTAGVAPGRAPERGLGVVTDFTYDGALRSIDESLVRLRLDRLDLVLLHDPDYYVKQALAGAYRALERLRSEGTVGAIGVSGNHSPMLTRFAQEADLDCLLAAGRYTLLDQSAADDLLPEVQERSIGIIIGGVYNSGILADPRRPDVQFDYERASRDRVDMALRIKGICDRHDVPMKAAALQFPLGHPSVASVLVGARSVAELDENLAMFRHPIPSDLWAELRHEGIIADGVPTP